MWCLSDWVCRVEGYRVLDVGYRRLAGSASTTMSGVFRIKNSNKTRAALEDGMCRLGLHSCMRPLPMNPGL